MINLKPQYITGDRSKDIRDYSSNSTILMAIPPPEAMGKASVVEASTSFDSMT
jgi:hypothetical protein